MTTSAQPGAPAAGPLFRNLRAAAALAITAVIAATWLAGHPAGQTSQVPVPLTLLTRDGRRPLPVTLQGDQEFVALDDLAAVFQLAVREDSLGAITVSYKGRTIVLTPDQALASVSGRLISLPAPPVRAAGAAPGRPGRWLVPTEFVSRALAPIYDTKLDLRKPSHLLIVGDLRVPRVAVRYDAESGGGRLTIDTTPRTVAAVAQDGDRLTIRFDADALDVTLPAIQAEGLVRGIRLADPVTLVVDVGPRFGSYKASTQALDVASRLTVDVVPAQTEAAAPAAPAQPTAPPPAVPDLSGVTPNVPIRTIAIDAGHGGEDNGVVGAGGAKEKDLTLAVARRVKTAIETRLGVRVLLTRDDDRNVPLDDRTATANHNKADLFISLHANASLRPGTSGAAIFVASFASDADDPAKTSLATERLPTFAGGTRDIELVLWDFAQTRFVDRSLALAKLIELQLRGHVPLAAHSIDRAPLRVLESANMPAVVIEMGYLSNAEQERHLTGNDFQTTLVHAVVEAVVRFRDYLGGLT